MNKIQISNIVGSVIETITRYNMATKKPYQNTQHIMSKDVEILVPFDKEEYIFKLNEGWKIIEINCNSIVISKLKDQK